ncbi:hypothetical protein ACIOKD_40935 [Streptomyces sp. NPDC087844]|uniref:hypothetical protein n=1 Tax=Streptomyces sp. NPDC087844 TaxID=3365805 RepID=UPI003822B9BF
MYALHGKGGTGTAREERGSRTAANETGHGRHVIGVGAADEAPAGRARSIEGHPL